MASGLPQIGNWGADFGNSMAQLGGAVGTFINPHQEAQARLKKALIEDPSLKQKLIDMEALNPGSVAQMYGKWAANLGQGTMSTAAEMEKAQRGLASQSVGQVQGTDTFAAQAALHAKGVNTKQEQTVADRLAESNAQDFASRKIDLDTKAAQYNAIKDRLPEAAKVELEAKFQREQKSIEEGNIATTTLKKYGDKLAEVADNIGKMRAGGKFQREYVPSFAETNALENTNPGFRDAIRAATERYANDINFARNKELRSTSLADRKEMLADNRARKYSDMAAAQGIPDADPVAMYEVFLKGYDSAKKDSTLKGTVDVIDRVNRAQGSMITGQLYSNVAKAASKIALLNEKLKKSKGSVAKDDIDEAAAEFNMQADIYAEHLKMTGQEPANLKKMIATPTEGQDLNWFQSIFASEKPPRIDIRAAPKEASDSPDPDKRISDTIAKIEAGVWSLSDLDKATSFNPDEKMKIKLAVSKPKTPRL